MSLTIGFDYEADKEGPRRENASATKKLRAESIWQLLARLRCMPIPLSEMGMIRCPLQRNANCYHVNFTRDAADYAEVMMDNACRTTSRAEHEFDSKTKAASVNRMRMTMSPSDGH
ncbi:hypothetical protein MKX07_007930 [Trichoderma sp. CBMAI-0711]|nr:hypothetical protein MKX07_007930 [Trichoderma sp. CBMAI-0711]